MKNMTKDKVLKFKVLPWYDKATRKIVYGVDSIHESGRVCHVCDNEGMLKYETEGQAATAIRKMNKEISEYTIGG
jgi:hypothetical protein